MSLYERFVFNPMMELVLDRPAVREQRRQALSPACGRVLEVGIGTGLNLDCYPDGVSELSALTLEPALDPRTVRRARQRGIEIVHVVGDGERLPFDDGAFDSVVCTFLLCSVKDPARVTAELGRVLAPRGQMLVLEHVAHPKPGIARLQRVLDPVHRRLGCGCSLVRETRATLERSGLFELRLDELDLPDLPPIYRHLIRGRAVRV